MRSLRDALIIAAFDLLESIRSRRVVAVLVLYLFGSLSATAGFISLLKELEDAAAHGLQVAETEKPGAMTRSFLESDTFLEVVEGLVGDPELALVLVDLPPIAMFYGWLAFYFAPILVTLSSADAITSEVAQGSVRYALFRTDRTAWAVGKLGGQVALMTLGVLCGALGAWGVGYFMFSAFDAGDTGWWLLRLSGRISIYTFPYLGLTLGISQLFRSVPASRGVALVALFAVGVTGSLLGSELVEEKLPVLAPTLHQLYPRAYRWDLWQPELGDQLPGVMMLIALGSLCFALGHLWFRWRDA